MSRRMIPVVAFILLTAMLASSSIAGQAYTGDIGATGEITAPANIKKGLMFYVRCTTLTDNYDYIWVPTASLGLSNFSFTADGTENRYQAKASATGSLTITLYGYNSTSAAASGSALDSIVVTISSIGVGVVSTDAFTDLLPWLIPIAIVIGLVGIFSIRKKLKAA